MSYGHVDGVVKLVPAPPGKTVTLARVPDKPDASVIYARKESPELEQARAPRTRSPSCSRWRCASRAWCATSACTPAAC